MDYSNCDLKMYYFSYFSSGGSLLKKFSSIVAMVKNKKNTYLMSNNFCFAYFIICFLTTMFILASPLSLANNFKCKKTKNLSSYS